MDLPLSKMEGHQSSCIDDEGHGEVVLSQVNNTESTGGDAPRKRTSTSYISSLDDDDDDDAKEDWPLSCEEKLIQKTTPQASLYERYVLKTIISPGIVGLRPHFFSCCTFEVENQVLLNLEIKHALKCSSVLTGDNKNIELNLEIGSSASELDRALEYALLDMYEGEKSEVILCATNRERKVRDQDVLPTPCLKCTITLKKINPHLKFPSSLSGHSSLLSLMHASKEEKYRFVLNGKELGVELFKKQQFVEAFHRFSAGVKILTTIEFEDFKSDASVQTLYSTLCSNMAECQLKENNPTQAIALCERALTYDPCNVKALYRQASAFWAVGDTDQADSVLRRLFELDPSNPAAKQLNCKIQIKIRQYTDDYTKMMKRIFNN